MSAGVYMITHSESGNCYVGSSQNVGRRIAQHKWHLLKGRHDSRYLQSAYKKYGLNAFTFKQVIRCAREMCLFYEQRFIDVLSPKYNTAKVAGSCVGIKRTNEQRETVKAHTRKRHSKNLWKGELRSFEEIAEIEGVKAKTLRSRVTSLGKTIEDAIKQPARVGKYLLEHDGKFQTVTQWAEELNIHSRQIHYRISEGYSISDIIARRSREMKMLSFTEFCKLAGIPHTTVKSRIKTGMSIMEAITFQFKIKENV